MSIEEILTSYKVVDLSERIMEREDGVKAGIPFGHITWRSVKHGDLINSFTLLIHEHTATHCDAPANHPGGKLWVDEVPLEQWMGPCCVFHMAHKPDNYSISPSDIESWEKQYGKLKEGDIALFNFGRPKNHPGLSPEAAAFLVKKSVKLVGVDTATIDPYNVLHPKEGVSVELPEPTHDELLPKNVVVVEKLTNLEKLPPRGAYFMALPLKIKGGSGSPLRAIAFVKKT